MGITKKEDSLNRFKFKQIIDKYGYPLIDRVGTQIFRCFGFVLIGLEILQNECKSKSPIQLSRTF